MTTIVIDDLREIDGDIVCRTYDDGLRTLKDNIGQFDCLYLDHDLGHDDDRCNGYNLISLYEEWTEGDPSLWPATVIVVTSNPSGRNNINLVLQKYYVQVRPCEWHLKE